MFSNPIIVGTLGGIASALLFLGAAKGSGLAVPLLLFSPLPVLIVALGWLPLASVLATLALAITLSLMADPVVGGVAALIIAVPGCIAAYLYTLSRPAEEVGGPEGQIAWYPIGDTFARALIVFSVSFVIVGVMSGSGQAEMEALVTEIFRTFIEANNANPQSGEILADLNEDTLASFAQSVARWMPVSLAGTWVAILVVNFTLAERITRSSGRLARPAPNWPDTLHLVPLYAGVFAVGVMMFAVGGPFAPIGGIVAGAFGTGFLLVGLAVIHSITRGMPARGLLLVAAYGPLILFGFPALLFVALGLAETFYGLRVRAAGKLNKSN
ncbi:MAG: DUF2232 domain-containing protein [Pseudomonadota bacterium]